MKNVFAFVLIIAALAFTGGPLETKIVNTEASTITWQGYKVTGSHTGTIALENGSLQMQDGRLVGGNFQMDMTTITVTDLSGGSKAKLEGHLKSPDFFGVDKFPNASFVITGVEVPETTGSYTVTGNLTIKNITEPITFEARLQEENGQLFGLADLTIDRSKYDVRYGSGSFFDNLGDNTIYDEFDLSIKLIVE